MKELSINTSPTPTIVIEDVFGNLQVKGWDQPAILLKSGDQDGSSLHQVNDKVHIRSKGDCLLRVPTGASLQVNSIHGWARFKLLTGELQISKVMGALFLEGVGNTHCESVFGDLSARSLAGDLTINQVLGNAQIDQIAGKCMMEKVAGNLDLRAAEGDLFLSNGGNARLRLERLGGKQYCIAAGGNIYFSVNEQISARITLSSREGQITIHLPTGKTVVDRQTYDLTLGDGQAEIDLSAGGMIIFNCQESWGEGSFEGEEPLEGIAEDVSQKIAAEIEAQLESQFKALDEQMSHLAQVVARAGISPLEAERIMHRARQASERASARAQERMRRAREKLDQKMAEAQRKMEQRGGAAGWHRGGWEPRHWHFEWSAKPSTRETEVTDEERLAILRLLEQKKITVEEAERLLAALEGKNP